ncbi:thioredoxin fold domain-containing protein [Methanosarcinaceae archaeon]|nr:thioredoxin fold domain-containing protein [Methanosarcinaceae archaeon]MBQ3621042.1 thioredoxin fold domain-containing protein [Methanosarcinaceae archaeon]
MSRIKIIDFSASWCGPCRMQKPTMEDLQKEYADKMEVTFVDVDEHPDLARSYEIHAVPTIVIELDGSEMTRFMGVTSKERILKEVEQFI